MQYLFRNCFTDTTLLELVFLDIKILAANTTEICACINLYEQKLCKIP